MFKREFIFFIRNPLTYLIPLLFFILVCLLFPLSISPNNHLLQTMGAGIIWIAIVLANLLSLPQLFQDDYEDGLLDQWLIAPSSLSTLISVKMLIYWVFYILPMILLAPVLALMYHLSFFAVEILMMSLLLGTPIIVMQGAIVASLCVGLRRGGLLLAIVLLPLYISILIFGSTVVTAAEQGFPVLFQLDLLGALLILAMVFGPSAIAFSLRVGIIYGY